MRFVLRTVGTLLLAVAVVFAVGDIARTIADEATRFVTIAEASTSLGLTAETARAAGGASFAGDLFAAIAQWSVSLTVGAIAMALIVLGRKARHHHRALHR